MYNLPEAEQVRRAHAELVEELLRNQQLSRLERQERTLQREKCDAGPWLAVRQWLARFLPRWLAHVVKPACVDCCTGD